MARQTRRMAQGIDSGGYGLQRGKDIKVKPKTKTMHNSDIEQIEKKKFEDAEGVNHRDSNTMLATRDYDLKCKLPHKIGVVHGIWIWWCDTHYQPLFMCDSARAKQNAIVFAEAVKLNDKTEPYEYGGYRHREESKNAEGVEPAQWTRWLTPREMALNFIRDLTR